MSGSVADRLPRLLALVPYLLARPGIAVAEAAQDFGVSEEQLRKDLELLWVCGLPGHGPGDLIDLSFDEDTIVVTYDAGISRPLRLTADEALALMVALRTLADVPGLAGRDAVERALEKVEAASGGTPASGVAVRVEAAERSLLIVQRALDEHKALHLSYYSATRDASTERDVDPMRLLLVEGRSYLEAWCRRAEDVRLFRLDRVDDARILDEPAAPPSDAQPRDLVSGVFAPSAEHTAVTLRLSGPDRWVADYFACDEILELPGGDLQVTVRVADTTWVRQLALGSGVENTILAPEWLAAAVRDEARRALAAYDEPVG
ncbi:MAG TPA: YafY family protein [Mycobacteriales bacterium]|nr:YafY family protein [Mycobacteriales bacterium]